MRLAHLHLPGLVSFTHASRLQQLLVSRLLAHKKLSHSPSTLPCPDPTILTFTPQPVYTTGRRDLPPSPDPNRPQPSSKGPWLPTPLEPIRHILTASPPIAEYHATLRGGQTTYHGPGQLVAYTILDLRRLRIGPRAHIRLLEETVLDVLAGYGIKGLLSDDPGVWVRPSNATGVDTADDDAAPRKIAAVACGLEGRDAASLEGQGAQVKGGLSEVAESFVQAFVRRVNEGTASGGLGPKIDQVYKIEEKDTLD
uniref:Octanoyltransferase n=1 Tax=Coccidioides posadasii RMSCC 3488 TaxID=454284 RepID=A0A0J6F9Y2_COCPO|nr:octanoyltransferase [Coccidioides posadasii RMSCC 3488]